jgi:hypothetical protein
VLDIIQETLFTQDPKNIWGDDPPARSVESERRNEPMSIQHNYGLYKLIGVCVSNIFALYGLLHVTGCGLPSYPAIAFPQDQGYREQTLFSKIQDYCVPQHKGFYIPFFTTIKIDTGNCNLKKHAYAIYLVEQHGDQVKPYEYDIQAPIQQNEDEARQEMIKRAKNLAADTVNNIRELQGSGSMHP